MTAGPLPALRAMPARILRDLALGLRTGRPAADASPFMIRYVLPELDEPAAAELAALLASGFGPEHAALLLEVVAAERMPGSEAMKVELVTSGPDAAGDSRDTGVILRQLFASAERRVLIVGFAIHQGREIFAVLAERMRQLPDLAVRMCVEVRRSAGDTTRADALLKRFAERFVGQEWPGPRLPDAFYDPRSLAEGDGHRASLHAKCVVVDGERSYIGSANFTEAAQLRNIEIGVVIDKLSTARAIEGHFLGLIERAHLARLPMPC